MAIIKCPECGHNVSDKAQFCPGCGIKILNNLKKCPNCGEVTLIAKEFCPNCGYHYTTPNENGEEVKQAETAGHEEETETLAFTRPQSNLPKKRKHTALILSIILGVVVIAGGITTFFLLKSNATEKDMEEAYSALQADTNPDDYQMFLDTYPDSPYAQEVKERMNRLQTEKDAWVAISLSSSKNDFIQFMNRFPNSEYDALCRNKIDSLDWVDAKNVNTPDAIQRYIDEHPDGQYIEDAKTLAGNIETLTVKPEERSMIASICNTFFTALGANDQSGVCSVISPEMTSFLSTQNATKADVITAMERMHPETITAMNFTVNNDYVITKKDAGNGQYAYNVVYSVDQNIERTDEGKTFASYKVNMEINPLLKVNMVQIKEISSH